MSEDHKDLGDKAEDAFDKAKETAKEFTEESKEKANEFADDAKKTAHEFTEGAKEAFGGAGGENKKILAGILAIVLGWLGVHKFILGYQKEGIIMAACGVLGWFLCGIPTAIVSIVGLVEGIIYLTKSDAEFYNTYQVGKKPWF
ncbi:TM2 domain-containing protein [Cellulophaga sp. Hel_I_12]|uniref:TM2 domain-containing protein n=1 Tax=Cellulophaga sp. Hel_I_12 TaxID=1249972 RepID=UPI000646F021|nr:TM2 domain-containing protein [Cellulophaga sp. Hel_I_12]